MPKLSSKSTATPASGDLRPFLQDQGGDTYLIKNEVVVPNNLAASAAPAVGDDSADGYAVGSRWIDTTNDKEYVCLDATEGAAVWTETTGAGGGASDLDGLTDVTVTSATEFQTLEHNGTAFVNTLPRTVKLVRNDSGSTITAGTLVEIHDANASTSRIRPADKDTAGSVDGIAAEDIATNTEGVIQVIGTYDGVDTSGMTAGTALWLGDGGGFVDTAPATGAKIRVAKVGVVHGSTGSLVLDLPAFEAGGGGSGAQSFVIACSDETTDLTTGTGKVTFRMPYAFTVSGVRASVTTAPTGSALQVDVNDGGTSILSTAITIDAGEKTSGTAATAAVVSDTALADDAEITIDIDAIGSTIAGAGLKVAIIGTPT